MKEEPRAEELADLHDSDALIQDLLDKNPEVVLAQQVMEQGRKTNKPGVTVDQSNYYRLP